MVRIRLASHLHLASAVLGALVSSTLAARADKIQHPVAIFEGLDKITGRIFSFDVSTDETVQFGSLQVTPRVCYTRPPTEPPQTDGFVEVDEMQSDNTTKRIFSGWMFAASPGLHGVEHAVYDVWLTGCKGGTDVIHDAAVVPQEDVQAQPPSAPAKPPAPPKPRQPRTIQPLPQVDADGQPTAPPPDAPRRRAPSNVLVPPGAIPSRRAPPPPPPQPSSGFFSIFGQ